MEETKMNIKEKRIASGITQAQLAEKLGVDRSTIAKWETGAGLPTADKLRPLAKALGCTIDELLGADAESAWEEERDNANNNYRDLRDSGRTYVGDVPSGRISWRQAGSNERGAGGGEWKMNLCNLVQNIKIKRTVEEKAEARKRLIRFVNSNFTGKEKPQYHDR